MENLAKAIIAVMKDVKGIEKSMTVGSGNNSYKGVSDKDVKNIIGASMEKNGLCILPTNVEAKAQVDRWTETGGQYGDKQKQSIFTQVKTKYLLLHESGESIELAGYGHGVDSQDKAAGKATTYALKYVLLYTFLVPTGTIDDADNHHSNDVAVKPKEAIKPNVFIAQHKENLTPTHQKWVGAVQSLVDGKTTIAKIEAVYTISEEHRQALMLAAV